MFTNYKIKMENGTEVLYLYLDEFNTEFAKEFNNPEVKERTLKSFIERNKINFKGSLVKIFLGTVLISTILIPNVSAKGNEYQVQAGDSLWKIAQENNISVDDLIDINNLTSRTIHPGDIIKVNVPSNYVVKEGDNLWNLAREFNTTVDNIRQLNNLTTDTLQIGQELIISGDVSTRNVYTVKYGDNLWNLAKEFNTTVDSLRQLNNLTTDTLQIGQELIIDGDVSTTDVYTVKYGDNLWNLAREFNTTVDSIRQLNNLRTDTLQVGQELIISGDVSTTDVYTVKYGDNLWNLAKEFNTTVDSIRQLNNLRTDTLQIGQELILEGDVSTTDVYTVKYGDNLWNLAREYDTTVANIKSSNNLTSDRLYVGQRLIIPRETLTPDKPSIGESYVRIKMTNGQIQTLELEEYIVGVVASEMDPSFHIEALKAQALAARTYAVEMDSNNEIILTTDYHQVYNNEAQLRALWGHEYDEFIVKVRQAVNATKGEVITYQDEYIEALYFSTSNGKTEDPSYVWGGELPYLESVESPYDVNSREYLETKSITVSQFTSALGLRSTSFDVKVLSYTAGDRIETINIGGTTFKGSDVKARLGLRSTDFSIDVSGNTVYITQRGFGHGVGMSQYGAHFMGQEGYSYRDIINHYYQNVDIVIK